MPIDLKQVKQKYRIIGNSPLLDRAIEVAIQVAPTDISVLILGESGVGKEVIPRLIHDNSLRKHERYMALNCGAFPAGTIDSELFGHLKGSFTGANNDRKGYFEEANGGTIFLDEVGELPLETQARLLRVLESGEFFPVGSSTPQKTDVRIIAATNVDLFDAVRKGRFRQDLLYRLNTVSIEVPSLRRRREDIGLLFRYFARHFAEKYHMPALRLSDEALAILERHGWPGNVRELRNLVERLVPLVGDDLVTPEKLEQYMDKPLNADYHPAVIPREGSDQPQGGYSSGELGILFKLIYDLQHELSEMRALVGNLVQGKGQMPSYTERATIPSLGEVRQGVTLSHGDIRHQNLDDGISYPTVRQDNVYLLHPSLHDHAEDIETLIVEEPHRVQKSLEDTEREMIELALRRNNGRRKITASELGISERTLYRKIKEYGLDK